MVHLEPVRFWTADSSPLYVDTDCNTAMTDFTFRVKQERHRRLWQLPNACMEASTSP